MWMAGVVGSWLVTLDALGDVQWGESHYLLDTLSSERSDESVTKGDESVFSEVRTSRGTNEMANRPWPALKNLILRFFIKSLFEGNETSFFFSSSILMNNLLGNMASQIPEFIPPHASMMRVL
jgi:hypothetical protein